jgi:PTS system nitrogen regulatory IIA component
MDGRPVHTLFTLVSPTVRDHLQLLSRLAFALKDGGFKAAIGRRASKDEMLGEAHRVEAGLRPHGGTSEPAKRKPKG